MGHIIETIKRFIRPVGYLLTLLSLAYMVSIIAHFDLNAVKTFTVGAYQMTLGVRIMNLFNNQWLTPMEGDDRTNWVNDGITVEDPARDPSRLSYVVAPYRAYRNIPRQIFFTLGVGF